MAKLVIGCGYLGHRVAERWRRQGHEVFVVTRSRERALRFVADGLTPVVADVMRLNTLLGFFLTPLFVIPATWLMDRIGARRNTPQHAAELTRERAV